MVRITYKMGQAAIHAHKYDQISYSEFNNLLWASSPQAATRRQDVLVKK